MKTALIVLLTSFSLFFTTSGFSFPELPFCPAGGPPGWFNHFTQNRDYNYPRNRYPYATVQYYQANPYQSQTYAPNNTVPDTQILPPADNRYYR